MRILLDTNIIVAGLISPKGPPGRLLRAWMQGRFELVTSDQQLGELARALTYEHVKHRVDPVRARDFVGNVAAMAIMVTALPRVDISPDPADNVILAAAVAGQAELVVSGDKIGMVDLRTVEGIPIVTASAAIELVGAIEE